MDSVIAVAVIAAILLGSPKDRIPPWEWALAIFGAASAIYGFIFLREISGRVGSPNMQDFVVAVIGLMLLLEAARRSLGPALMIVATVFLIYTFLGPLMPAIISHKGNSLSEVVNHQWITTEGVFGIALGVSTSFVFLFVLFGAHLGEARARATILFKIAFSPSGPPARRPGQGSRCGVCHERPLSQAPPSPTSVTTGTFTIPLMKRTVGFSPEKGRRG